MHGMDLSMSLCYHVQTHPLYMSLLESHGGVALEKFPV